MGDTIEDMGIEKEQKDKKLEFLGKTIDEPDCKVIEEMNRLGLNKISSERKGDRNMYRLNISLTNHKNIKIKKRNY